MSFVEFKSCCPFSLLLFDFASSDLFYWLLALFFSLDPCAWSSRGWSFSISLWLSLSVDFLGRINGAFSLLLTEDLFWVFAGDLPPFRFTTSYLLWIMVELYLAYPLLLDRLSPVSTLALGFSAESLGLYAFLMDFFFTYAWLLFY